MKIVGFIATCFLFIGVSLAQTEAPQPIDSDALAGKQIKVIDPKLADELFAPQTKPSNEQIVLANGEVQTKSKAQASGAAVICQFSNVTVYQNGYIPFFSDSKLEIKKIDRQSVPSLNLVQLNFTVHHSSFVAGRDHLDRQFTCYNEPGTIFSSEALVAAFGNVFAL